VVNINILIFHRKQVFFYNCDKGIFVTSWHRKNAFDSSFLTSFFTLMLKVSLWLHKICSKTSSNLILTIESGSQLVYAPFDLIQVSVCGCNRIFDVNISFFRFVFVRLNTPRVRLSVPWAFETRLFDEKMSSDKLLNIISGYVAHQEGEKRSSALHMNLYAWLLISNGAKCCTRSQKSRRMGCWVMLAPFGSSKHNFGPLCEHTGLMTAG